MIYLVWLSGMAFDHFLIQIMAEFDMFMQMVFSFELFLADIAVK